MKLLILLIITFGLTGIVMANPDKKHPNGEHQHDQESYKPMPSSYEQTKRGPRGATGPSGNTRGVGFGLIQYAYDPNDDHWQAHVGAATFDNEESYTIGVGKTVVGGFLNLNVGTSDGKTGAGAAYGWTFK